MPKGGIWDGGWIKAIFGYELMELSFKLFTLENLSPFQKALLNTSGGSSGVNIIPFQNRELLLAR